MIVGFQAQGTLGRKIVDGSKRVRILGEEIAVAADVYTIGGLSAHADRDDLLAWAGGFRKEPDDRARGHGEESVSVEFAAHPASSRLGWDREGPVRRAYRSPCDRHARHRRAVRPPVDPGRARGRASARTGAQKGGARAPTTRRTISSSAVGRGRAAGGPRPGGSSRSPTPSGRTGPPRGLPPGGPGLLTLNYFTCPMLCPMTFRNLSVTMSGGQGILPFAGLPGRHGEHRPGGEAGDRPGARRRVARASCPGCRTPTTGGRSCAALPNRSNG